MSDPDRHLEEPDLTFEDREEIEAIRQTQFEDRADAVRKGES